MEILQQKNIVILGGATGIGEAITRLMARNGARVVIGYRSSPTAEDLAEEIRDIGGNAYTCKVDVTDSDSVEEFVRFSSAQLGTIHAFCNNAGVSSMSRVVDMSEEDWDFNMNVNAKGVFLSCRAEARFLIDQGFGKIINTASMASKRGVSLLAHYCASKYAVVGFSKSLALELAPFGITVNCICPGLVKTPMQEREIQWESKLRGISAEDVMKEYIDMTPLGRLEEPEDIAKVAVFLASGYSDFMTGQAVNVTGGIETN